MGMAEVEKLIEIYQKLEDAGLMVVAGKKDTAELMVSHDVVPVVRCKDCKHYEETTGKDSGKPCGYGKCVNRMTMLMAIVYDEDFCSYGERKDNE